MCKRVWSPKGPSDYALSWRNSVISSGDRPDALSCFFDSVKASSRASSSAAAMAVSNMRAAEFRPFAVEPTTLSTSDTTSDAVVITLKPMMYLLARIRGLCHKGDAYV